MGPLLRLLFRTLLQTLKAGSLALLVPVIMGAVIWSDKGSKVEVIRLETAGIFAGGIATFLLLAWGFTVWSLETTARCVPLSPPRRFRTYALFAALLAVPLVLFCASIPRWVTLESWQAVAPPRILALTGALGFMGGAFLLGSAAVLAHDGHLFVRVIAMLAGLSAGPAAVGLQVTHGVPPYALAFGAFAVAVLAWLYLRFERDLETRPGGSPMIKAVEDGYRAPVVDRPPALESSRLVSSVAPLPRTPDLAVAPPRSDSILGSRSASPERVLLRAMYSRWSTWAFLLILFAAGVSAALAPSDTPLFWLMFWLPALPIQVWSGFQPSALPRRRAFLVLFGPLFALQALAFGAAMSGRLSSSDVDYLSNTDEYARMRIPTGWDSYRHGKTRIEGWTGSERLPGEPREAARLISGLLREILFIPTTPEDILALHPDPASVTAPRFDDPRRAEWVSAIRARFDADVARIRVRRAWVDPLTKLFLTLLCGLAYFTNAFRAGASPRLTSAVLLLVGVGYGAYMMGLGRVAERVRGLAVLLVNGPVWIPILLALLTVLLVRTWYAAFRNLETKPGPTVQTL